VQSKMTVGDEFIRDMQTCLDLVASGVGNMDEDYRVSLLMWIIMVLSPRSC
jgi:hypothetical protein